MSILSTPTPARPIIFNFSARSKTSAVTFDAERTINASKFGIISKSSSCESLSRTSTLKSFRKSSIPSPAIPSAARMLNNKKTSYQIFSQSFYVQNLCRIIYQRKDFCKVKSLRAYFFCRKFFIFVEKFVEVIQWT